MDLIETIKGTLGVMEDPSLDVTAPESRAKALELMDLCKRLSEVARNLSTRAEEVMLGVVRAGGDITCGDIRYYVKTPTKTVCRDKGKTIQAILEASGGDFDAVVKCLSSEAIKHGACREFLGDSWGTFFEVIEEMELGVGKPDRKQVLGRINTAFMPNKPGARKQ